MGFKNLTKYAFICCQFNVVWQIVHQPGSWCSEGFLSVYCCMAFCTLKSQLDSDRSILTGIYFSIRSLIYSGAVPLNTLHVLNGILYNALKCTGSKYSWNKTGVIYSLWRARVTRRAAQFCTRRRRFVRKRGVVYNNALP